MLRSQGSDAGRSSGTSTGETCVLYCGDGKVDAGRGMAKHADTQTQLRNDRKLDGTRGKGSSDACPLGDGRDAAQSATHLDVLACVVAS